MGFDCFVILEDVGFHVEKFGKFIDGKGRFFAILTPILRILCHFCSSLLNDFEIY
jgi:hypothetical protein